MRTWKWAVAAIALTAMGCGSQPGGNHDPESGLGTLTLSLVGTDTGGAQYRLRSANFEVSSYNYGWGYDGGSTPFSKIVSSETDPDSSVISTTLLPNYYSVTLQNSDWYLEKVTAGGPTRVEKSVLLSEQTQSTYVWNGGTTAVDYRFGVDGDLIDFRHGQLDIGITIEHPGEGNGYPDSGYYPADAGRGWVD